jgi:hypothetical protein
MNNCSRAEIELIYGCSAQLNVLSDISLLKWRIWLARVLRSPDARKGGNMKLTKNSNLLIVHYRLVKLSK